MYDIEFYATAGKRAEFYNGKLKYPYERINHCIEQLNILLCRGYTKIDKDDIEIIMKTLRNKQTFTTHYQQLIKKLLNASFKNENIFWVKQDTYIKKCHQRSLEVSKGLIDRHLYIFYEVDKGQDIVNKPKLYIGNILV